LLCICVSVQVDMIKHMEVEHGLRGKSIPLVCSATLVENTPNGFVQCPVHFNMSNQLEYVAEANASAAPWVGRAATGRPRGRRDDDSDDGGRRNARRSKNGKKTDDAIQSMAVTSSSDHSGLALTAPAAATETEDEEEDDEGHE